MSLRGRPRVPERTTSASGPRAWALDLPPEARADLHLHTRCSDGRDSPQELLDRAFNAHLSLIAITDHDLPPPLAPGFYHQGARSLLLVAGTEITTFHQGRELHLLAYQLDAFTPAFESFLRELGRDRVERFRRAGQKLGLPDGWMGTKVPGQETVTRLQLGLACLRAGRCASLDEAWRGLLGFDHGYLEPPDLSFERAIGVCRSYGVLTSWAHPDPEQLQAWIRPLVAQGLQGIEALRPGMGRHRRVELRRVAEHHGLVVSGGSDWHGRSPPPLGFFAVPLGQLRPLLHRIPDRSSLDERPPGS